MTDLVLTYLKLSEIQYCTSESPSSGAGALELTVHWIHQFLAKPHKDLGRSGAVCPFIPLAIEHDTLRIAVSQACDPDAVKQVTRTAMAQFASMEPKVGMAAMLRSILILFPAIQAQDISRCIDQVQRELRPEFVKNGLMVGEFHPANNTPGLHSDHFFPLRTPVPSLAIRTMIEQDIVFLSRSEDHPSVRENLIQLYLAALGTRLTQPGRERATRLLAHANVSV